MCTISLLYSLKGLQFYNDHSVQYLLVYLYIYIQYGCYCTIFCFSCSVLLIVVYLFVLFHLAIVLSVRLRLTGSDYPVWYLHTLCTEIGIWTYAVVANRHVERIDRGRNVFIVDVRCGYWRTSTIKTSRPLLIRSECLFVITADIFMPISVRRA